MIKKIIVLFLAVTLIACSSKENTTDNETVKEEKPIEEVKEDEIVDISFSAVGDNLIHGAIFYYNQNANLEYTFDYIYEPYKQLNAGVDISYINQETLCAGEELELSSYPTFNGPYEILDAVHDAGFNWLSTSSNHSMDRGEQGILNQLNYLSKYSDMVVSGTQASTQVGRVRVKEVQGVKIGLTSYTYGLNGFEVPLGKEYLVNLIDKDLIKEDMEILNKESDIQIVSMHWGEEYQFIPSAEQEELAQYLSDLGVDVIIGGHPHVIQPMDYLTGKDGNETLVMYSLGNFLSAQDENYRMLGGNARWDITYNKSKQTFEFKDVEFWPTITFIKNNYANYVVYPLKDYTDEMAKEHTLHVLYNQDLSRQYFIDLINSTMNDKVKIVY